MHCISGAEHRLSQEWSHACMACCPQFICSAVPAAVYATRLAPAMQIQQYSLFVRSLLTMQVAGLLLTGWSTASDSGDLVQCHPHKAAAEQLKIQFCCALLSECIPADTMQNSIMPSCQSPNCCHTSTPAAGNAKCTVSCTNTNTNPQIKSPL